ncbi:MAG: sialidase family protein, partial [Bacteroidota bacterium]
MYPKIFLFLISLICICFSLKAQNKLVVREKVDFLESLAREPMLAEHPNGDLYVTGYTNTTASPQLWKSTDQGKTWSKVPVGSQAEGADGNSDVDLVIDENG